MIGHEQEKQLARAPDRLKENAKGTGVELIFTHTIPHMPVIFSLAFHRR